MKHSGPHKMMLQVLAVFFALTSSTLSCSEKTVPCALKSGDLKSNESFYVCPARCITIEFNNISSNDEENDGKIHIHLCSADYSRNDMPILRLANLSTVTIVGTGNGTRMDCQYDESDYSSSDMPIMRFVDLSSVTVVGMGNGARIDCQDGESGLHFHNVSRIDIKNISLNRCSYEVITDEEQFQYGETLKMSVLIFNSTNVSISNVMVANSSGAGLVLLNDHGPCHVNITGSTFDGNYAPDNTSVGGGILIRDHSSEKSKYCIHMCNLTNNKVIGNDSQIENKNSSCNSCGAGIDAYFFANGTSMDITNCTFQNNHVQGGSGGALNLHLEHTVHDVSVTVMNSQFQDNNATKNGGAVAASYIAVGTKIRFISCNFTGNKAERGGAVFLHAYPSANPDEDSAIVFEDSRCEENKAHYGMAIYGSPHSIQGLNNYGYTPTLTLQNCLFTRNRRDNIYESKRHIVHYSRGTIYLNTINILLRERMEFIKNKNSALHLFASKLEIGLNSRILFKENFSYQGGAIHMRASASIYLNDNTSVKFEGNVAVDKGGAIYHDAPVDPSHQGIQNCFVKYTGDYETPSERNISVKFLNNTTWNFINQSIYTFSVQPCYKTGYQHRGKINTALDHIGDFEFLEDNAVSTAPSYFKTTGRLPETLIPGIEEELPISVLDDTKQEVLPPVYKVQTKQNDSNIMEVEPAYAIVTNNKIKVLRNGKDNNHVGKIRLTLLTQPDMTLEFDIMLQECPPGYVNEMSKGNSNMCYCSANTRHQYLGIQRCNRDKNKANLTNGYWAGYHAHIYRVENFRTSNCPQGYCGNTNVNSQPEISLPHSATELNDLICSENREGVICALCKNGSSVLYRDQNTYPCAKETTRCYFGILFFVLSQILPVTVLFLLVIFFDIQLTTGIMNGFLFYIQIFEILSLSANDFIPFPKETKTLLTVLNFIVGTFNLKFFSAPAFSFCLFKGATSLDVIAFDYIIVVYSLLLTVSTVIIINLKCYRTSKFRQKLTRRKAHFSASIIHGLSGFLVMCYARTTTITLKLLTPVWLYGKGPMKMEVVVYYNGDMKFFGIEHLKYAMPALLAFILMTLLPPVLLLSYPLCYKVLACLRLGDSRFSMLLCKVLPLEKFKPFFDSFQGTFKDNHRYFAGLYFVYRFIPLMLFVFTSSKIDFLFYFEIQLILMLALHSLIQPYKQTSHNRLDIYIITLLLVLNSITSYNYQWTLNPYKLHHIVPVFSTIQVLLAYSPIVFMAVFFLLKIKTKACFKHLLQKFKLIRKGGDDLSLSLAMLDESREDESDTEYHNF